MPPLHTVESLAAALGDRYRIERELGSGGMATVYLAEDVKHRRRVAIKVLHAELSAVLGPERFLKEIELTANLQHPHILPLFDSGSAEGRLYYVMPFVDGETLRARLLREQQLPVADAVRIATETADALAYAHKRGVVHRDIKPENILLQNGHALVADFGIALAVEQAGGTRMTQTGLSLGTPQYMSPEQAMGERTVDARTDIYALGAVTYEMLAGEPPFTGANAQAIVAKVLTAAPEPLSSKRPTVPPPVDEAVAIALQKLPADRFASASEFARALVVPATNIASRARDGVAAASRPGARVWLALAVPLALLVGVVFGYGWRRLHTAAAPARVVISTLLPLPGETWPSYELGTHAYALSPDGARLAVVTAPAGGSLMLSIRPLDRLTATTLAGTEDASVPFWSPDGTSLGFFADHQLKTIDIASGTVRALCPAPRGNSGSWSVRGVILYVPQDAAELYRVAAAGGPCSALRLRGIAPSTEGSVNFLPDGEHFVFSSDDHTWLGRLGSDSVALLRNNALNTSVFAAPDYLLFPGADRSLTAQRIDVRAGRLVGAPRRMLGHVTNPHGFTNVSASRAGTLVAGLASDQEWTMAVVPRGGGRAHSVAIQQNAWTFGLAHDGRRLAMGGWALWAVDVDRGIATALSTSADSARQTMTTPVWAPGDTMVAFTNTYRHYGASVFDPRTDRVRALFDSPNPARQVRLTDWSPDGAHLAFELGSGGSGSRNEPWVYDVAARALHPLFTEAGDAAEMRYSPDGRWLAYQSNVSGESEIYLRAVPGLGTPVRVSPAGGRMPRWRGDGRELYYVAPGGAVLAVSIGAARDALVSAPSVVVPAPPLGRTTFRDVEATPDGRRFVFALFQSENPGLTLVQNWWTLVGGMR